MKKVLFTFIAILAMAGTIFAAPLTPQAKEAIQQKIKAAGNDKAALVAAMKSIVADAPADSRDEAAVAAMQALSPEAAADTQLVATLVSTAVKAAADAAAASGAGQAGQTASATEVANALLKVVSPEAFAEARAAAIAAGADETQVAATAGEGGSGDQGINNQGEVLGTGNTSAGGSGNGVSG